MMKNGFTLAELLLALVILGVIATFTIPKVLQAQQNNQYKSSAKEVASMFSGAYQAYRQSNTAIATTNAYHLTPFMNYVAVDTSSLIDNIPLFTSRQCDSTSFCLRLHNGGMLHTNVGETFGGTASTNAIYLVFDPDAVYSGSSSASAPGKAVMFVQYYDGFLTSRAHLKNNTCTSATCYGPGAFDPDWFDWN